MDAEENMRVAPETSVHRQQQALAAPDTDVMSPAAAPARPSIHALQVEAGPKSHRLRDSSIISISQPMLGIDHILLFDPCQQVVYIYTTISTTGSARTSFAEVAPPPIILATVEASLPVPARPSIDTHAAAAAQRAYMQAIRRLHAIKDLENKSLAYVPPWRTELMQKLGHMVDETGHALTIWRNAIHSIEGRQGTWAMGGAS